MSRGLQDTLLPDDERVLRANKVPENFEQGQVLTRQIFNTELSSKDKSDESPKLSVYAKSLTTEMQACKLIGTGKTHRLVATLNVEEIRNASTEIPLDVVWDEPKLDDDTPDTRPGAEGHAGVMGLKRPPSIEKTKFKDLQSKLADIASKNYKVLSEEDLL
jgi:hypothetical protein